MRKIKPIAFALLASVFLTSCSATEIPQEKMITTSTAASVQSEVLKIRAQDDFYGYINAEYLNNAKIDPKSGAAGSFYDLAGTVDKRLDELIDEIIKGDSNSYKPGSNEQLIRDLYYKVLDASTGGKSMNAEDITYLKDKVAEIRSVKNIDEYLKCRGTLYKEWRVNPIFGGNIDTNLTNSSQGCIQLRPFSSPDGTKLSKIILDGRVANVHLILVTSTPQGSAIPSEIRDGLPCRIAFCTASNSISKVVIGRSGAEKLKIPGQMIFKTPGDFETLYSKHYLPEEFENILDILKSTNSNTPTPTAVKFESLKKNRERGESIWITASFATEQKSASLSFSVFGIGFEVLQTRISGCNP